MEELPGFSSAVKTEDKPKKKKSGGFENLRLSQNVIKGIQKRGYKQPTPIQRKTIPLVLEGRDVVAMARTGSGKTACFLLPMFEKLKTRSAKAGARALIFSPTRELALQTVKFIKELGRFVGLKPACILGGDSMEDQFSALHGNPDVIVATPGRFMHICIEMELKLNNIEYVVFDEADRLFEMGLGEQLTEILRRLPDSRQTVLFSATLPKVLVEFAKAGLSDPVLIRLDVESKIPAELLLHYLILRAEEKMAGLLVLLKMHIDESQQTVVFAATKHHIEYIHAILDKSGISNTYIYSNLDPSARKINAAKFSTGKVKVLVVTDVAARGIDIPQLDNVINYNFPAKPKLFVHRVGRCARAGRSGNAYSLVSPEEYAYLVDLHLFLGRSINFSTPSNRNGDIGRIPLSLLEEQHSALLNMNNMHSELQGLQKSSENGYQQYVRSRPTASSDSNRRIKDMPFATCSTHPMFKENNDLEEKKENLLGKMKQYRPQGTIFEICGKNKSQEYLAMKEKRLYHKEKIALHHKTLEEKQMTIDAMEVQTECTLTKSNAEDIDGVFDKVIVPKKRKMDMLYKKNKKMRVKDENYIPYAPADKHTEEGLAVNSFEKEANKVQFDIVGDSEEALKIRKQMKVWDRQKKKMVAVPDKRAGKIQTESGTWIPATYKTNRYAEWKERAKIAEAESDEEDKPRMRSNKSVPSRWSKHNEKLKQKQRRSELKSTDQILKMRKIAEKKKNRQKGKRGRQHKNKKS